MTTQGKRRDLTEWLWTEADAPQPGDYGKYPDGKWYAVVPDPDNLTANLNSHEVVEHEDGTITVNQSFLVQDYNGRSWHGFIERGVWREV